MTREDREALRAQNDLGGPWIYKRSGLLWEDAIRLLDALDATERELERWKSVEGLAASYSRDADALRAERDRLAEFVTEAAQRPCDYTVNCALSGRTPCLPCRARAALAGEEPKP